MKNDVPREFEALALPQKELPHFMGTHYRIYSDEINFVTVAAQNALEALKASGLQKVFRIQRDIILLHNIVALESMADVVMAPATADMVSEAPQPQPAEPQTEAQSLAPQPVAEEQSIPAAEVAAIAQEPAQDAGATA